jgi:hypothetical protein
LRGDIRGLHSPPPAALARDRRNAKCQRSAVALSVGDGDRPLRLTMHIGLKPNVEQGHGTLIDVKIAARRGRDRRIEEVADRAEYLLKSLKSYLIAEEY